MSCRLSDIWAGWINKELPRLAPNERAKWDMGVTMAPPPPQGPGGLVFILTVMMPGVVLGTSTSNTMAVNNPVAASQEQVKEMLSGMVAVLRTERARQASEATNPNGGGAPAGPTAGGIILPS